MKNLPLFKILMIFFVIGLGYTIQAQEQDFFRKVDVMPEFKGGQEALNQFITKNIKYPEAAINSKKEGTVYVTFIIEKDGSISQIKALKGIGEEFEREAEKVVKKMPKWTPGMQNNEAVRVMLSLPIEFKLSK